MTNFDKNCIISFRKSLANLTSTSCNFIPTFTFYIFTTYYTYSSFYIVFQAYPDHHFINKTLRTSFSLPFAALHIFGHKVYFSTSVFVVSVYLFLFFYLYFNFFNCNYNLQLMALMNLLEDVELCLLLY